ncbi:hypothetical protein GR247_18105 [Rhizobium leguminosarum]|nr:hypothetical protein [Rhizobium leguminosarum]NKK56109.1 hypothetical protein [Rhizobium leguminosarum bv. viciae]
MNFDLNRAVALLTESQRSYTQVRSFSPAPQDREQAYAVQTAVCQQLGEVGGWKVGARGSKDTPNCAPLLKSLMQPGPAIWRRKAVTGYFIEGEIAFKIGRDIPASTAPLSPDEVFSRVTSVHAAIEIVDTRLVDLESAGPLWKLADNQMNGGFVFDPVGIPWSGQDFADAPVALTIAGTTQLERRGGNPAGNPAPLLVWLVNHCITSRGGISAGSYITTGSYTGMTAVGPGATVVVEFPGIGRTQVRFGSTDQPMTV